jgi:hypothetical protein
MPVHGSGPLVHSLLSMFSGRAFSGAQHSRLPFCFGVTDTSFRSITNTNAIRKFPWRSCGLNTEARHSLPLPSFVPERTA